jgi:hypothetical protein
MDELPAEIKVRDERGFLEVLPWLPAGWEQKMRELGAFRRARGVRSPRDLLRMVLAVPLLLLSLTRLQDWAAELKLAEITPAAVWKRLRGCARFLEWLVDSLLGEWVAPVDSPLIWTPLDASTFSLPGSTGRDWLIHFRWSQGRIAGARLSKGSEEGGGESLRHVEGSEPNEVMVADRAYGTPPGVAAACERGQRFLARFTWNNLPLYSDREGQKKVEPRALLGHLRFGEVGEFQAWVRARGHRPCAVRVVAVRLPEEEARRAWERSARESRRKRHVPLPNQEFLSAFVVMVTNLAPDEASAAVVADAYRWRWQIELEFKRLKSITQVRRLTYETDESVRVYLLALLAVWLLSHKIARQRAFFPWGYPLGGVGGARTAQLDAPAPRRL